MAPTTLKEAVLQNKMVSAGKNLLGFSSVASTTPIELIWILNRVEGLLSEVKQLPSKSMKDALQPSMEALVSDRLLKHSDFDVRVSVASCMSELIRITAPDAPYDDNVQMKDILHLIVMALGLLSSEDAHRYLKGYRILGNMTNARAGVLMVDLGYFVNEMFRLFLSTTRYPRCNVIFRQMEAIMTRTLQESDEISDELLSILLTSVNIKRMHVSSRPWMLGGKVLINCTYRLRHFLPKFVRSENLSVDNYSPIVAHICLKASED
ncbi:Sister chromatid cohesion protein PDS5 [Heracleum sosnowskyi]|uniref:Sister chromatid cohesion protein PDS5 n=1 Tax=Heracleum sosnowskyi TaxID=360622 RepID=A0AAD8H272_9APIA|nr:Sister chromatid cohesion protein PDS5 [Heracleum sosnowskyi]